MNEGNPKMTIHTLADDETKNLCFQWHEFDRIVSLSWNILTLRLI